MSPVFPISIENKYELWRLLLLVAGLIFLIWGCFEVLQPFIPAIIWAIILCLTAWPAFDWLLPRVQGRINLAASIITAGLALCFIVPLLFLGTTLADDFHTFKNATIVILESPEFPMPHWITSLPLIGGAIAEYWPEHLGNTEAVAQTLKSYAEPTSNFLLKVVSSAGKGVLDLTIGILIAFFFFRHGDAVTGRLNIFVKRFLGVRGQELLDVSRKTMIGVVYGVLGAALAQATIAGVGFAIAGIPGAPLLGLLTFILSFLPLGPPLIWGPAALWLFNQGESEMGIFMILWGIFISSADNFIRPYFISLESALPLLLVILGVFGGLLAFGFIGMFIGPTLLAVAYTLIVEWSSNSKAQA